MLSKSQKEKKVKSALAINSLDAIKPSKECMKMLDNYINGTAKVEDNIKKLTEKYKVIK